MRPAAAVDAAGHVAVSDVNIRPSIGHVGGCVSAVSVAAAIAALSVAAAIYIAGNRAAFYGDVCTSITTRARTHVGPRGAAGIAAAGVAALGMAATVDVAGYRRAILDGHVSAAGNVGIVAAVSGIMAAAVDIPGGAAINGYAGVAGYVAVFAATVNISYDCSFTDGHVGIAGHILAVFAAVDVAPGNIGGIASQSGFRIIRSHARIAGCFILHNRNSVTVCIHSIRFYGNYSQRRTCKQKPCHDNRKDCYRFPVPHTFPSFFSLFLCSAA